MQRKTEKTISEFIRDTCQLISQQDLSKSNKIELIKELFTGIHASYLPELLYASCVHAIKTGQEAILKLFVETYKTDVNFCDRDIDGWTLLQVAAYYNRLSMVKYLLQQGAVPQAHNNLSGFSPFHMAIGRGHVDVVEFFVKTGIHEVNFPAKEKAHTPEEQTISSYPLDIAALGGHLPMIQYLLDKGVTYESSPDRWDAIQAAAAAGHLNVLQFLIEKFKVDIKSHDIVNASSFSSVQYVSRKCYMHFPDFAASNHSQCFNNVYTPHYQQVVKGCGILSIAAATGHLSIVEYLVGKEALYLPDSFGFLPIHSATMNGHLEIVRFFVEKREKAIDSLTENKRTESPLHIAAKELKINVAEYLLARRASVSLLNAKGKTPLRAGIEDAANWSWDNGEYNDYINMIILLFDSKQFTLSSDFNVVLICNQEKRFRLINCILANSLSIENGYHKLIWNLRRAKEAKEEVEDLASLPVPIEEPSFDELSKKEIAIREAREGLLALAGSQKFFLGRLNVSNHLVFQRIESAAKKLYAVAGTCKEKYLVPKTNVPNLANHILSFLLCNTNLKVKPISIVKAMRPCSQDQDCEKRKKEKFFYEAERARFYQRLTNILTNIEEPSVQTLPEQKDRQARRLGR